MPRVHLSRFHVLLLLVAWLPGCGQFDFSAQEFALRHEHEADALTVEITYRGVQALRISGRARESEARTARETAANLEQASEALQRLSQGARLLVLGDPFFTLDLDREPEDLSEFDDFELSSWVWTQGITVLECHLEHDARGQLSIRQVLRLAEVSRGVELLNQGWCRSLIEWNEDGVFAREAAFLDDASRRALLEAAQRGVGPFELTEGTLSVTLPINSPSAARMLAGAARNLTGRLSDETAVVLHLLLSPLTDLEVTGERLVLSYGPDESGALQFVWPPTEQQYDPALNEFLREEGVGLPRSYVREE